MGKGGRGYELVGGGMGLWEEVWDCGRGYGIVGGGGWDWDRVYKSKLGWEGIREKGKGNMYMDV